MNKLEKLALNKLEELLYSVGKRCAEENEHRIQHERPFILQDINEALYIVESFKENDKK